MRRMMTAAAAVWTVAVAHAATAQTTPVRDWVMIDLRGGDDGALGVYLLDRHSIRKAEQGVLHVEIALVTKMFANRGELVFDCADRRWMVVHSTFETDGEVQESGAEGWEPIDASNPSERMLDVACTGTLLDTQERWGNVDPVVAARAYLAALPAIEG